MALDIGELQLRVKTDSEKASSAIDKLSNSLNGLKGASKGNSGLNTTAKNLNNLSAALNGVGGKSLTALERLNKALSRLPTVSTNIGSVATQLNKLGASLGTLEARKLNHLGTAVNVLTKALEPLSNMPKQNIGSYFAQIKKFPQVLKDLKAVDLRDFASKIREVADALKPLADEMEKVSKGFSAFPSKIQKFLNSAERMPKTAHRSARSFVKLGAKIGAYGYTINRVGRVLGNFIKETNDYVETYNLFSVSMGKYAKEAEKYARTVESVLGIDPKEWMRAQGVFQTLATGFGVASDRAYTMSKNLTQLGYDLSSFFNISVAESMQKLQSALAGELEPVRRVGYDLSQAALKGIALDPKNYTKSMENMANAMSDASLKQFALNQGIKVSYENMTQAQKSQLRYIALMTQVTVVQGDMARTLNSGANQIRIFQAQVTQATRALGTLFIPILNKVLPYLTAIATVVRDIATVIAKLFNIKLPTIDNSAWNQASESVENIGSGFKDATKQAKKFKATILGIDELNLMADNSGGEGTGTGDLGGYGGDLDFALPEYDFLKGATESRVSEITEKMKEWLGLTKEINSWTEFFNTNLGKALTIAGIIGAVIAGWKLSKAFEKLDKIPAFHTIFNFLKEHKKGVTQTITIAVGVSLLVDSFMKGLKKGVSGKTVLEAIGGGAMAGMGIGSLFGAKGAAIGAAVGAAIGAISQLVLFIYQNWDKITDWWNSDVAIIFNKKWWSDLFEPVVEWFKKVWEGIKLGFAVFLVLLFSPVAAVHKLSDKIVEWWNEKMAKYFTKKWWDEKFAPLKSKIDSLSNWFSESWDKVKEWFSSHVAPKFTKEYWSEKFKPLKEKIDSIGGWFSTAWGKVKSWFNSNVAPKFTAKFWQDKFDTIKTGFKNTINGLIGLLERGINFMVRNINKLHWDAPEWVQKEFGVTGLGFRFNEVKIPRLADGGQVNTGQMFIAREAGAELVGNVGRRTTVMNNEQIVEAVAMGVRDAILSTQSSDSGDITIVFNNEGGSVVEKIKRENLKAGKIIVPVYD